MVFKDNIAEYHFPGDPQIDATTHQVEFEPTDWYWYMKWYYILGLLWIAQLVYACEQMVIAGAVSAWYFTR